ncbi:MAG: tetratricopeptide repeat protein [Candidatus Zixiibacteriota bacterium]
MSQGQMWSIIIVIIIIFFVIMFFRSKAKRGKGKVSPKLYTDALKALLAGDEELAFQRFKDVARGDPENVDAYLKLGDLFRKRKKLDKAIQIHRELTLRPSLYPEEKTEIWKSLAEDYIASQNHEKAISVLEDLHRADGDDQWVNSKLISEYEETERWEEAFELKKKLSKHKDDEANKVLALYKVFWGKARADRNEFHKARVAYKEALNYDETCIPAYIYLGEAYYRDGRLDDAIEYWKKLLDVVPSAGYLVFDKLEKTLFELGQYGEIAEIYERIASKNPKNIYALSSLANIYEKKGMIELAIEKYRQILDIDPNFLPSKLSLIKIYQEKGWKEQSIDLLDSLIEELPPGRKEFVCNQCEYKSTEALWKCPRCKRLNSFDI